ncbi:MAG: hypothetical protein RR646_03705 [Erysipelotrichaceae bacterium]
MTTKQQLTPKDLLYIEDSLAQTLNTITIQTSIIQNLIDPNIKKFFTKSNKDLMKTCEQLQSLLKEAE